MTTHHLHNEITSISSHSEHTRGTARGFFKRLLTRLQQGRTIAALERLDDYMLRDIGITRSEIPYVAARVAGLRGTGRARKQTAPVPSRAKAAAGAKAVARETSLGKERELAA